MSRNSRPLTIAGFMAMAAEVANFAAHNYGIVIPEIVFWVGFVGAIIGIFLEC